MRMEFSDRAKTFALEYLDQFDGHISAKFLLESIGGELGGWESPGRLTPDRGGFPVLHCVSYFGIAEVANTLIKMKRWDVNQRDGAGVTPLIWAARHGHEEVVRLLLRNKHIQPDQQDANFGRTALSWAAGSGHEGVVRLFLGPGLVNIGSRGGRWGKVRREAGLLFGGKYVNLDSSCKSGRTSLSWASENGHEGVVRLLLERKDVNPDSPRESNSTPLLLAAKNRYEGIVKLLLGRKDVNPNGLAGLTPFWWATVSDHEGMVRLLLIC